MKGEGRGTRRINSVRDLEVYKLAFETAMEIFEMSKQFPKEETYSLTGQARRSSRLVLRILQKDGVNFQMQRKKQQKHRLGWSLP